MGDAKEPCRGVLRYAVVRPGLKRAQHSVLHALFGEIEVGRPQKPRQVRHHAPRLVPEQVLQDLHIKLGTVYSITIFDAAGCRGATLLNGD